MTLSSSSEFEHPRSADTWYDVLEVDRDVDSAGVVVACERALALIDGRRMGGYRVLDPADLAVARADIEAARAVLTDPERRKNYDRSIDGDDTDGPVTTKTSIPPRITSTSTLPATTTTTPTTTTTTPRTSTPPSRISFLAPVDDDDGSAAGDERERERVAVRRGGIAFAPPTTDKNDVKALLAAAAALTTTPPTPLMTTTTTTTTTTLPPSAELWPSIAPEATRQIGLPQAPTPTPTPLAGLFSLDGEVNGQTIRRLREARRIDLVELADLTKIRKIYLAAIEDNDLENLPSRVYLRGFLTQIARVLRVDKVKLADGYVAFIERFGR